MSEISLKPWQLVPNAIFPRDQIDGLFSVYLQNGCAWRHSKTHSLLLLLILCRAAFHSIHTTHWFEPRQWPYRMAWDWLSTVFLAKRSCPYRNSKHSDSESVTVSVTESDSEWVTDTRRQAYIGLQHWECDCQCHWHFDLWYQGGIGYPTTHDYDHSTDLRTKLLFRQILIAGRGLP